MVKAVISSSFGEDVTDTNIFGLDVDVLIREHLKKLNFTKRTSKNKKEKRTDSFSPSQSSYSCCRMLYYNMLYPRPPDEDSFGVFAIGDLIHDIIEDVFVEAGVDGWDVAINYPGEKRYYDNLFKISGECDILIKDLAVIDIKSVSPWAWKYVAGGKLKGNVIIGKPKIQHVRQLNTYMDIFGIKKGFLLYVNKDNLKTYKYELNHSNMTMLQTVGRCATAYRAIQNGNIPERSVSDDECAYCNHRDMCRNVSNI